MLNLVYQVSFIVNLKTITMEGKLYKNLHLFGST